MADTAHQARQVDVPYRAAAAAAAAARGGAAARAPLLAAAAARHALVPAGAGPFVTRNTKLFLVFPFKINYFSSIFGKNCILKSFYITCHTVLIKIQIV